MNKLYFIGILKYAGLPIVAKYILDFVIDNISPKYQQLVAPVLGCVLGFGYGAITTDFNPELTWGLMKDGALIGVATLLAHKGLPDFVNQPKTDPNSIKK